MAFKIFFLNRTYAEFVLICWVYMSHPDKHRILKRGFGTLYSRLFTEPACDEGSFVNSFGRT